MTRLLPPPHDLRAEEICLSAVLWGDVAPAELGLDPRWFFAPEHQWLWALLLTAEELDELPAGPASSGLRLLVLAMQRPPDHAYRRLLEVMEMCPGVRHNGVRWMAVGDYAALVRRRWRDRQLCRGLQLCDAALRLGDPLPARASAWVARELRAP